MNANIRRIENRLNGLISKMEKLESVNPVDHDLIKELLRKHQILLKQRNRLLNEEISCAA